MEVLCFSILGILGLVIAVRIIESDLEDTRRGRSGGGIPPEVVMLDVLDDDDEEGW